MVDYRKRVVMPLFPTKKGAKAFDVIIYGRTARELCTVPNDTIRTLARRYPDHSSTPWHMRSLPNEY